MGTSFLHRPVLARLALGIVVLSMVPLVAATDSPRTTAGEPWPDLMSIEAGSIDATVAALQQRANDSLEQLVRLASLSE